MTKDELKEINRRLIKMNRHLASMVRDEVINNEHRYEDTKMYRGHLNDYDYQLNTYEGMLNKDDVDGK